MSIFARHEVSCLILPPSDPADAVKIMIAARVHSKSQAGISDLRTRIVGNSIMTRDYFKRSAGNARASVNYYNVQ
jgi:hypothetical protein